MQSRYDFSGLDLLRAFALISVFLFHLFPQRFPGGFLGVSMFFVLSGFLTTVRHSDIAIRDIASFYFRKLTGTFLPALLIVTASCGLTRILVPSAAFGLRGDFLSIAGGFYNIRQIQQSQNYFAQIGGGSPFLHLWTLSVEMQFLLAFPWIAVILREAGRKDHEAALWIFAVITGVSGMLMPLLELFGAGDSFLYYSTVTRIFPLLLGMLAGYYYQSGNALGRKLHRLLFGNLPAMILTSVISSVLVLEALLHVRGQSLWTELLWINLSCIGCALLVLAEAERNGNTVIGWELFKKIRSLSLDLYLWQYPVIFLCSRLLGVSVWSAAAEVIVTVLLTAAGRWFVRTQRGLLRQNAADRKSEMRVSRKAELRISRKLEK